MGSTKGGSALQSIREQCFQKGLNGIKGLCVLFRGLDHDYSKRICFREFKDGMLRYGIKMAGQDLRAAFDLIDKDGSGFVDFREFLLHLTPPIKQCRTDVINEAFDKLDAIKDDILKVEDLMIVYRSHAEKHPKYISKEWTIEEVLANFLETFDSADAKDGMVTREEFHNYYVAVSSTVDDDAYFDLMMRACWGLPPRGSCT